MTFEASHIELKVCANHIVRRSAENLNGSVNEKYMHTFHKDVNCRILIAQLTIIFIQNHIF